jgi:hypothetical protein
MYLGYLGESTVIMDNLMFEWIKNLEASTFRECLKNILDNSLLDPKNRAHTLKS